MGKRIGYGRVSTRGQERDGNGLKEQRIKLTEAGCSEIILEAYTGTKMNRPEFNKVLNMLEESDTLVVCKLDRFARTAREGLEVVEMLMKKGVNVHILNMGLIENTPMGNMLLTVMLAFAQFERDCIVERTQAGKALARLREDYHEGRPRKEIPADFLEYVARQEAGEITITDACREMNVARPHWYRWKQLLA
ncbi:MAG: recombinase family protein [Clostridia bacterium]|nr:recombinase family protein [Clostridia bacterium]